MNWKSLTFFPETARETIEEGKSLNVKFGIDPTRERVHIGHLVPMLVARDLQRQGHQLHLILGTMTAQLGDPSGRDTTRPILNDAQVRENSNRIFELCNKIFEPGFITHRNEDFFKEMGLPRFLTEVASRFTTTRLLSREGFRRRLEHGESIGLHELILPLLQGWDSVQVDADVEIGGTDQLFNFQVSRELQEKFGQKAEVCIMAPILNGTDGRKMSKSFNNCIWIDEDPKDIFGKIMSLSDEDSERWISVFFNQNLNTDHPMERKKILANELVGTICGHKAAVKAKIHFHNTIVNKQVPDEIPEVIAVDLLEAVVKIRGCSKSAARRLIEQGGVRIDGNQELRPECEVLVGHVIKVGKRDFAEVV